MPPRRSEVWNVDFGMIAKMRPAVVVSVPYTDSDRAVVTVIPHYTSLRGSRWEIDIPVRFLRQGAFVVQGIASVDKRMLTGRVGKLDDSQMNLLERELRQWLAL